MFSMAKFSCCRFHGLFIILLVLCAFSLVNHYFVDATGFVTGKAPCQVVQSSDNCTTNLSTIQGANLHGGFMLNSVDDFSIPPTLWFRVENTKPYTLTWKPPALVRPPIFS